MGSRKCQVREMEWKTNRYAYDMYVYYTPELEKCEMDETDRKSDLINPRCAKQIQFMSSHRAAIDVMRRTCVGANHRNTDTLHYFSLNLYL